MSQLCVQGGYLLTLCVGGGASVASQRLGGEDVSCNISNLATQLNYSVAAV